MQTIPPFDYIGEDAEKWNKINEYILTEIKSIVDFVFDNRSILGKNEKPEDVLYGLHPNEEGCRIWANALYKQIKEADLL